MKDEGMKDEVQQSQRGEAGEVDGEGLRNAARAACSDGKMSQAALAREIGISGTTFSQWLNERYQGDNEAVAAKVAAWQRNRQASTSIGAPASIGWVDTLSSADIEGALLFARNVGSIALVYGDAGLGKTTAICHYAEGDPNVWRTTATPASRGLMATLEAVAAALELRDLQNRPSVYSREIIRRLSGTRGLLVIDEAQHLSVQALEELRSIHDASGVGLALVGNQEVYNLVTGGARQATFAQLFSRIGFRLKVQPPTRSDTDAILAAWGVVGEREREWAHCVACLNGGLRNVSNVLRQASLVAAAAGRAIDVSLLKTAHYHVGGAS